MARTRHEADEHTSPPGGSPDHEEMPMKAEAVRVLRPLGFIDAYGDTWHWTAGQVVRNPYVLGLLASRGAYVEPVE